MAQGRIRRRNSCICFPTSGRSSTKKCLSIFGQYVISGTDSLMFGDEAGLGTPSEDFASISAVNQLDVAKYLVCLGFGIDHFHGVSHHDVLANIAQLASIEAYLGSFSLSNRQKEGKAF